MSLWATVYATVALTHASEMGIQIVNERGYLDLTHTLPFHRIQRRARPVGWRKAHEQDRYYTYSRRGGG
jgi:hypothetical protein